MKSNPKSEINNIKTSYIFGIEVYAKKTFREYMFDTKANYSNCFFINERKVFSFFKVPFYEINREHEVISYFLFGIKIRSLSVAKRFYENNFKNISVDYDDAYILGGASGEPFLWIAYGARAHFDGNNSKKPLVVGGRNSFAELVKMYLPDVSYLRARVGPFDSENAYLEYNSHRFFTTLNNQKNQVYFTFHSSKRPKINVAFTELALTGKDNSDLKFQKPYISNEIKEILAKKTKGLSLNLNNFVILAPEANWSYELPAKFWEIVVQKFINNGVDVFLNFINGNHYIYGCKTLLKPLSYSEIFELTSQAKAVISLRSGFSEIVLPTRTPSIVVLSAGRCLFTQPKKYSEHAKNPLVEIPFVREEDVRGVYYFDYETDEAAADAVLSCYDEMMKIRANKKED